MAHFRFHHTISSVKAFYEVHQRDSQVLGVLLNIWISSSSTLAHWLSFLEFVQPLLHIYICNRGMQ